MGMFDTYRVNWGNKPEDVQTKQLSCLLDYWRVGERVQLAGYGDSDYGNEDGERLHLSTDQTFAAFTEQTNLANMWSLDDISSRHVVLSHKHGLFCDYAGFKTQAEASNYCQEIERLWTSTDTAPSLSLRLALFRERNALAQASVEMALAQIDPRFLEWRSSEQKARNKNENPSKKEQAWSSLFAYRGPSFEGISRTMLRKAIESLTQHWLDASLDFSDEMVPAQPSNPTEEFAIKFCNYAVRPDRNTTRGLGAPSLCELAKKSMPFHTKNLDEQSLLNLLHQGYWEEFETAFSSQPVGTIDVMAKEFIAKISLSRFGATWAAGAMAKNPRLAIESIQSAGNEVPILDWFIVNMGLPSNLVEPLCSILPERCASRDLPFYCVTPNHATLFPIVFSHGSSCEPETILNGHSLIETAISASEPSVLSIALRSMMQSRTIADLQWEHWAELALSAEAKAFHRVSAFPGNPGLDFNVPSALPSSIQCLAILFQEKPNSFDFSKTTSANALAWFAHQERKSIDLESSRTSKAQGSHQPRL